MQTTLEGKLMLNAPQMESSKNWMLCLVSALHSFLHRKHKQEFTPSPEGSAAHQRHQEIGEILFFFFPFFHCLIGFETLCSSYSTSQLRLALHSWCSLWQRVLGGRGLCTHRHCSTSNCHNAGTTAATYCYLPLCTHCWWAVLWWGKLLSVPNAVYFCKNLILFSRTTGKISMGLEDLSRLWDCYHWEIVLLSKCPISSFYAWLIIDIIKMSRAFCALCFPLSWWFSQTFLRLKKVAFCSSQSYKWLFVGNQTVPKMNLASFWTGPSTAYQFALRAL